MIQTDAIINNLMNIKERKPLVHHITNGVTISECANITLCFGALPVMAHAVEEVAEMVRSAGALVLNIGTLTPVQVEAMLEAGREANRLGVPIVLDPVGVGATSLRTASALRILEQLKISIVKGNSAEIAVLAGLNAVVRGVEAGGVEGDLLQGAKALAKKYGLTVVATGIADLITDGERLAWVENGHPLMGSVVGTGCMGASVVGSFAAVEPDCFKASLAALVSFGIVGELAAVGEPIGPGSFKARFFDWAAGLSAEHLKKMVRVRFE